MEDDSVKYVSEVDVLFSSTHPASASKKRVELVYAFCIEMK